MAQEIDDRELLNRFKQGDKNALRQFYERHESKLYFYFYSLTKNHEESAEHMQSLFLGICENTDAFIRAKNVRAYLFGAALNLLRNQSRSQKRFTGALKRSGRMEKVESYRSLVSETETFEEAEKIQRAVLDLPEELRQVLILKIYESFSFQEISEICATPVSTLHLRYGKALELIREKLASSNKGAGNERT